MVTLFALSNGAALYKTVHDAVATGIGVRPTTTTFAPRRSVDSQEKHMLQPNEQRERSSELVVSAQQETKNCSAVMKNVLDEYMNFFKGPKKATLLRKLLRQKGWMILLFRLR
ncbi:hypothetical protein D918_00262 [Trichuris suis]|nr:hypothetical protein D918_00262 [Trichuris suis]